jgi:hypothetical protein
VRSALHNECPHMKIAILDYVVTRNNPGGSSRLTMLEALCHEHEFTVFSAQFENPCPERIRWVRVPVVTRPQALLYVAFHLLATVFGCVCRDAKGC